MKKFIILLSIITSIFIVNDLLNSKIVIPKEAIRFRVIANSNSSKDQKIKYLVKNNLVKDLYKVIKDSNSISDARNKINSNMDTFKNNIDKTLLNNNYKSKYTINYGNNYFPKKSYKGIEYKSGKYESLVVTIGSGRGKNFFCVLFPPLCMLDDKDNYNKVKYHILVKDLIKEYLHK